MKINLCSWRTITEHEGPGKRFALWVQGCHLHCQGCCNPHTWALKPKLLISVDDLQMKIAQAILDHQIEGITLLGGEPMLQARSLTLLAAWAQKQGLSVMTFTGLDWNDLDPKVYPGCDELLQKTDVLLSGPFIQSQASTLRNWAGSDNQIFHYLSGRYDSSIESDPSGRPCQEIHLDPDGRALINGWPLDTPFLAALQGSIQVQKKSTSKVD